MLDFQSRSSYPAKEILSEKRKTEINKTGPDSQGKPYASPIPPSLSETAQDYSTFLFQGQQMKAPPATNQSPFRAFLWINASFLQGVGSQFERIVSQVVSFFFGNRKDQPTDEERERRRLNYHFTWDALGESKVEEASQSGSGNHSQ